MSVDNTRSKVFTFVILDEVASCISSSVKTDSLDDILVESSPSSDESYNITFIKLMFNTLVVNKICVP